jgi:hypothetical protein
MVNRGIFYEIFSVQWQTYDKKWSDMSDCFTAAASVV